jgi:sarcosine oxidase, subunit alpha
VARRLSCPDDLRGAAVDLTVDGKPTRGFDHETVATAAFASGVRVMSRSLKYHRPRTFFCLEGHCGGCLVRIDGVPNLRACQTACRSGQEVESQNAYPSAELDLFGAVDFLFPRGMDHHTLMTGSSILNNLASKVVRQLSGLGRLPAKPVTAGELPAVEHDEVDVCVIGGGPAGLAAATTAAAAGATTLLVDDQLVLGGSLLADPRFGPGDAAARVRAAADAGVRARTASTAIAFFPEDASEAQPSLRTMSGRSGPPSGPTGVLAVSTPRCLVRVHAKQWIWATGGYAVNLLFTDNDRPGVLAARAVGRLLVQHGVIAGDRICVVEGPGMGDYVGALVSALTTAGAEVTAVEADAVERARGRGWVTSVELAGRARVDCDVVAVAALPSPASDGPRQQGCAVRLDPARGGFAVQVDDGGRTTAAGVWACGDVCGYVGPARATANGRAVGANAAAAARGAA